MAEQVVAFKGHQGKLYASEKDADNSFAWVPYTKLRDAIEVEWAAQRERCGYKVGDILMNLRPKIEEYFAMADKVFPRG